MDGAAGGPSIDRRRLIVAGAAGLAAAPGAQAATGGKSAGSAPVPTLVPVFTAYVTLGPLVEFGTADGVRKRFIPITGGTFSGPEMRGRILPGGGDWQGIEPDGTAHIDARYSLETHDGAVIGISNPGIRRGPAEVLRQLAEGKPVDPRLYYFRTAPTFTVADGPYAWLRQSLFACSGVRRAADVEIAYFRLT